MIMAITPNRTTTIPIIVGGGTYITPGAGYHNRHRIGTNNYVSPPMKSGSSIPPANARHLKSGGITVTDVYNNRISNTVTPQSTQKESIKDNITITRKVRVEDDSEIKVNEQLAYVDLTSTPQKAQMNYTGTIKIFVTAAAPGDEIIVNNPFIQDASTDVRVIDTTVSGTTPADFVVVVGVGMATITFPAGSGATGYIIVSVKT